MATAYTVWAQNLDVEKDVKANRVRPGEYFVLRFNFASVGRTRDLKQAAQELAVNIIDSLREFFVDYHEYLGKSSSQLISEHIDPQYPIVSLKRLVRQVRRTLREVRKEGDIKHPLASVKGVSDR
jgi:hypothetical protein